MKRHCLKVSLLTIFASVFLYSCGPASKINRADIPWTYEIESAGVGSDGTYALKVWSYSRTPEISLEIPKKNAVHAVIFKGIPAGNGATAQPPFITDNSVSPDDPFFTGFFSGEYARFINSVAKNSVQIIKSGKREYKIGYAISVSKDELRKYLESQGIIKALSEGF